jgi:3-deoxy-D-manno-octulosonate 8-phosphate phosphatase (KDO 8-P phosphatase)
MNVLQYFKEITTFVFDVDGVLTDGRVMLLENGLQARQMHVRDGLALQMALQKGYNVVIISGGYSDPVLHRMHYLGVTEVYLSTKNKKEFLEKYLPQKNISWKEVLFMGDDLPDLPALQQVGLPCCPADAINEVKAISKYISPVKGGRGCVRDVIEKALKLNDHWNFNAEVTSR